MERKTNLVISYHAINCRVIDFLSSHGRHISVECIRDLSECILENMIKGIKQESKFKSLCFEILVDFRYKKATLNKKDDMRLTNLEFNASFFDKCGCGKFLLYQTMFEDCANNFLNEFIAPVAMVRTVTFNKDT